MESSGQLQLYWKALRQLGKQFKRTLCDAEREEDLGRCITCTIMNMH
jgi:hypothetical protein